LAQPRVAFVIVIRIGFALLASAAVQQILTSERLSF
jgi:hypothetical protein